MANPTSTRESPASGSPSTALRATVVHLAPMLFAAVLVGCSTKAQTRSAAQPTPQTQAAQQPSSAPVEAAHEPAAAPAPQAEEQTAAAPQALKDEEEKVAEEGAVQPELFAEEATEAKTEQDGAPEPQQFTDQAGQVAEEEPSGQQPFADEATKRRRRRGCRAAAVHRRGRPGRRGRAFSAAAVRRRSTSSPKDEDVVAQQFTDDAAPEQDEDVVAQQFTDDAAPAKDEDVVAAAVHRRCRPPPRMKTSSQQQFSDEPPAAKDEEIVAQQQFCGRSRCLRRKRSPHRRCSKTKPRRLRQRSWPASPRPSPRKKWLRPKNRNRRPVTMLPVTVTVEAEPLFDFDKYSIRADARKKLDQLVAAAEGSDLRRCRRRGVRRPDRHGEVQQRPVRAARRVGEAISGEQRYPGQSDQDRGSRKDGGVCELQELQRAAQTKTDRLPAAGPPRGGHGHGREAAVGSRGTSLEIKQALRAQGFFVEPPSSRE